MEIKTIKVGFLETNCYILTIDNTIIIWYNINEEQIAIDDSSRQITR